MKTSVRLGIGILLALPLFVSAQAIPAVTVPDHCTASDSGGSAHTYSTGQFLGICALVAAKEQGAVSAYSLAYDDSFGFYVQDINGIIPSATQYWALYLNGAYANDGLSSMVVAQGNTIAFQLTDFTDNSEIGSPVSFTISLPPVPAPATAGSGRTLHGPFDITRALNFLSVHQRPDGSFGSLLLDDWVAIATAVGGSGDMRAKLSAYAKANPPLLSSITDNERHAMALESLGINPYSGTPVDYISPIVGAFDGTQVGDPGLVNDDIFALFPLLHAGYTAGDDIIKQTVAFILARQKADGSWEGSADLTAASVQALANLRSLSGVSEALPKATGYLRAHQKEDGGFGNSFSTSWVLQAIGALDGTVYDWQRDIYTPDYFLATAQERDGGVEPADADVQSRIWATAYAIPAIKRATWNSLLSSFAKPLPVATSTAPVATATSTTAASTTEFTAAVPAEEPAIARVAEEEPHAPVTEAEATSSPAASTANQAASAASADGLPVRGEFLRVLWRAVTSFFSWLF